MISSVGGVSLVPELITESLHLSRFVLHSSLSFRLQCGAVGLKKTKHEARAISFQLLTALTAKLAAICVEFFLEEIAIME